jgi:hypothetical protein
LTVTGTLARETGVMSVAIGDPAASMRTLADNSMIFPSDFGARALLARMWC